MKKYSFPANQLAHTYSIVARDPATGELSPDPIEQQRHTLILGYEPSELMGAVAYEYGALQIEALDENLQDCPVWLNGEVYS